MTTPPPQPGWWFYTQTKLIVVGPVVGSAGVCEYWIFQDRFRVLFISHYYSRYYYYTHTHIYRSSCNCYYAAFVTARARVSVVCGNDAVGDGRRRRVGGARHRDHVRPRRAASVAAAEHCVRARNATSSAAVAVALPAGSDIPRATGLYLLLYCDSVVGKHRRFHQQLRLV